MNSIYFWKIELWCLEIQLIFFFNFTVPILKTSFQTTFYNYTLSFVSNIRIVNIMI